MILEALSYIRSEIAINTSLSLPEIHLENFNILLNGPSKSGICLSVINQEEEKTFKNDPHYYRVNGEIKYKEPAVHLNLYLMIAIKFDNYGNSLDKLAEVIELFQSKQYFDSTKTSAGNPFPSELDKLILDLQSPNFEELNYMWGMLGGNHYPSALYKIRIVKIQKDEEDGGHRIENIEIKANVSN